MATMILYLGIIIIIAIMTKEFLARLKLPALVGYITIGIILRFIDHRLHLLNNDTENIIHFLAELGVIILLFQIGLESKLQKLLKQIKKATLLALGGIAISAICGFVTAYFILQLNLFISMIIASALVATSVGVSAGIWEENNVINTDQGQVLLDTAEFDDIIGVILMALLFAIAPTVSAHSEISTIKPELLNILFYFLIKLFAFGLGCIVFSRYAEKPLTKLFNKFERPPEESLTIIAFGLIIASLAALLGFSVAIGAFFAGLIFSRDPASIKTKTAIDIVYDFFVPFFFIGIGLKMQISSIAPAFLPALVLTTAAFLGKYLGTASPGLIFCDLKDSALLGISMIPRAEVAMIIMQRSLDLNIEPMPQEIYTAMVITSITTCIIPPLILNHLIRKYLKK